MTLMRQWAVKPKILRNNISNGWIMRSLWFAEITRLLCIAQNVESLKKLQCRRIPATKSYEHAGHASHSDLNFKNRLNKMFKSNDFNCNTEPKCIDFIL